MSVALLPLHLACAIGRNLRTSYALGSDLTYSTHSILFSASSDCLFATFSSPPLSRLSAVEKQVPKSHAYYIK